MRGTSPPGRRWLARKAVAGERWDDNVERICGSPAVRGRVDQRSDDLQLLNDRSRPAMGVNNRQSIGVLRLHMDKVYVEPIDVGDEVRIGEDLGLGAAPIMMVRPIISELLHCR